MIGDTSEACELGLIVRVAEEKSSKNKQVIVGGAARRGVAGVNNHKNVRSSSQNAVLPPSYREASLPN